MTGLGVSGDHSVPLWGIDWLGEASPADRGPLTSFSELPTLLRIMWRDCRLKQALEVTGKYNSSN